MSILCLIERLAGLVALPAAREKILSSSWKFPEAAGEGEQVRYGRCWPQGQVVQSVSCGSDLPL